MYTNKRDDSAVVVITVVSGDPVPTLARALQTDSLGIEHQCPKLIIPLLPLLRRRQALHNTVQDLLHPQSALRADIHVVLLLQSQHRLDLRRCLFRRRVRQVHLVDHRQELQIRLKRDVEYGQGLRLDTL